MRDPQHIFRKMWAAESWGPMQSNRPACWDVNRNNDQENQPSGKYFEEVLTGAHCYTNWYVGNDGELGRPHNALPGGFNDNQEAPALLGFDESIDSFCKSTLGDAANWMGHAERCVEANLNILSLFGQQVPYNICRNLEWQVCAANGLLPGQGGKSIKFAKAPKTLDLRWRSRLGVCSGWVPNSRPSAGFYGYATDDIFYLEACLFNEICANKEELFALEVGEAFACEFYVEGFLELQKLLTTPVKPDPTANRCMTSGRPRAMGDCSSWCNKQDCFKQECVELCSAEMECG